MGIRQMGHTCRLKMSILIFDHGDDAIYEIGIYEIQRTE
jgi:hypothetical protein